MSFLLSRKRGGRGETDGERKKEVKSKSKKGERGEREEKENSFFLFVIIFKINMIKIFV